MRVYVSIALAVLLSGCSSARSTPTPERRGGQPRIQKDTATSVVGLVLEKSSSSTPCQAAVSYDAVDADPGGHVLWIAFDGSCGSDKAVAIEIQPGGTLNQHLHEIRNHRKVGPGKSDFLEFFIDNGAHSGQWADYVVKVGDSTVADPRIQIP